MRVSIITRSNASNLLQSIRTLYTFAIEEMKFSPQSAISHQFPLIWTSVRIALYGGVDLMWIQTVFESMQIGLYAYSESKWNSN